MCERWRSQQTTDCLPSGPGRQGAFNWIVILMSNKEDVLIGHDQLRASRSSMANITHTHTHNAHFFCHTPVMLMHWWLWVHSVQDLDVFDARWSEQRETKTFGIYFFSDSYMVALGLNSHQLYVPTITENPNMVIKNLSNMAKIPWNWFSQLSIESFNTIVSWKHFFHINTAADMSYRVTSGGWRWASWGPLNFRGAKQLPALPVCYLRPYMEIPANPNWTSDFMSTALKK